MSDRDVQQLVIFHVDLSERNRYANFSWVDFHRTGSATNRWAITFDIKSAFLTRFAGVSTNV